MTIPAAALGLVIATLYGALYHVLRGGGGRRLLLYFFLSWLGFGLGQWLGILRSWDFLSLGTIKLGAATVGSYIFLGFGDWLSRFQFSSDSDGK